MDIKELKEAAERVRIRQANPLPGVPLNLDQCMLDEKLLRDTMAAELDDSPITEEWLNANCESSESSMWGNYWYWNRGKSYVKKKVDFYGKSRFVLYVDGVPEIPVCKTGKLLSLLRVFGGDK